MDDKAFLTNAKHLLQILSDINEEVIVVNEDMTIIYINQAARRFGFDEKEVLNQSIFLVFPYLNKENSSIVKVFATGEPVIGSICTYITPRGERKIALTSTYPIKEQGKIIGAYEIGEDISGISELSEKYIIDQQLQKKSEFQYRPRKKDNKFYDLEAIIGESEGIKRLKEKILRVAGSQSNVLIYGETGTGKELVAQSIYSLSKELKNAPFIAQNCAAIPETLLESLLFGTVKGSFTGADNRPGLFELADGGVLFLDEINSMPVNLQAKILRVIQEGEVRRIGAENEIPVNFKLIASTNVAPQTLLETGELRRDLYYRLNVLYIEIPPLRDRKEDIPYLLQHFIHEFNKKLGKDIIGVDQKTMDFFMAHTWPGNIRELKNMVEGLMNMANKRMIKFDEAEFAAHLAIKPENIFPPTGKKEERIRLREEIKRLEIKIITDALKQAGGNVSKAARELDIPQQTLNNKINRYQLRPHVLS